MKLTDTIITMINAILPPRCIGTGEIVTHQGVVSSKLWQELDFISPPFCNQCGIPFEYEEEMDDNSLCGNCIVTPPRYDLARAAVIYNDASRRLLLKFKYGDQQHAAVTFANWCKTSGLSALHESDYIVPVPLHWRRHWQRRFNQSALIAAELSRQAHIPLLHALSRRRFTGPQKGLNRKSRLKNVRLAFRVKDKYIEKLKGSHIILIDDVMTSGATVNECARVLKYKGAANVSVLTVARVIAEKHYTPEKDGSNPWNDDEGY